jgi:hypothetical protein
MDTNIASIDIKLLSDAGSQTQAAATQHGAQVYLAFRLPTRPKMRTLFLALARPPLFY